MRVVGYTPLHYGRDYLWYAIRSVQDCVERHIILYTPTPSYGYQTDMVCPDTEEELRAIAEQFPHVEWHSGQWRNESEHRGYVNSLLHGEDILLPVDADEVWGESELRECLDRALALDVREIRLHGFIHLYKSFWWGCTDAMSPARIINLRQHSGIEYLTGRVYHFGYAQSNEMQAYKWAIHGHKNELRRDCQWFEERYADWRPGVNDVHPTCVGTWNPKPVDAVLMPEFMREHPWYGRALIDHAS